MAGKGCVHMIRRMVVATLLAMPMSVLALGLGEINLRSGLNQPFEAEIPLLSVASDEIDTLNVGLAAPEVFEQAGVERPFHLTQLRFKVEQKGNKPYIHAYSQEPIKEPYLQYLLEVNWRGGRLVKEFTVLLDPPTLAEVAPPPIQAPKAAVPPAPVAQAEVAPRPAQETPGEVTPPAALAPQSTIPSVSEPRENYTVKPGESLWSIAQKLKPDETISAQQIMLAILKQNPDAFVNKNINALKAHAILTIPDFDKIIALSKDEAKSIVKEHNAGWKGLNQKPVAPTASTPQQEPAAKLKLVAPAEEAKPAPVASAGTPPATPSSSTTAPATPAAPSTAASTADSAAMQAAELDRAHKELTLANEAVEARRQENDELRSRLAALEEQTASTQRLIKLKDEELATLQAKMKEIEQDQQSSPAKTAANAGSASEKPLPAVDAAGESSLEAMWSALIGNPLGQAMVATLGLLLVSMLWLVKRRHEAATYVAEESVESVVAAQTLSAASPSFAASAPTPEKTDPLAEADDYIHHQHYAQAETVLKHAIANDPQRHEIRLKLLELYSRTKNVEAFTAQARDLHDSLRGHGGPLWDKVMAMGKELDPNEPLFGGQTPLLTGLAGASGFAANEMLEVPPAPPAMETGASWLDRESAGSVSAFGQASPTQPAMEQGQPGAGFLEGFPAHTEASPLQPLESLRPSPVKDSFDSGAGYPLDLDLQKEAERLADTGVESALPPEGDRPAYLESGELTTEDEVATKLDLARAYMDMGDPDGAQSILDEVMKEGNESQRREAEELLRKIG